MLGRAAGRTVPDGKRLPLARRPVTAWVAAPMLLAVIGFVVWLALTVRIGAVVSESMEPTLQRGDVYLIRIDAYRKHGPRRGDIVVIGTKPGEEPLVKRVIGLGNDRVVVVWGMVRLNGLWAYEPYVKQQPGIHERALDTVVPEGRLFLMGDYRNLSEDSRDFGPLPAKNVVGKVTAVILPWSRRGRL